MNGLDRKWLWFVPILVIYAGGMFIDVMEIDAAQYATMSLEMLTTGNYLEIYYRGEDYIDKPPLLFWTSALSYWIFGASNFSYKLPSVLFTLLGLFSVYRLGRILYSERAAYFAALTLASCQAWFLINHDVRTDTILAACTIFGIWQVIEFNRSGKILHIAWAAVGIAGAMMTKGPIGLMVPALAIGTDFILKRKWSSIFRWQWLLLLLLVFVLLVPMMYGLYTQYDLSQGKQTYNGVITSGLRFYFWTQSFGRLTGESTWANETDPFFFVHTFLWSFLPWSIFALIAFWLKTKEIWRQKFLLSEQQEAVTFGGILFPFIALSLSRFKLPHYIYVFFPLVAVLTGAYIDRLLTESGRSTKVVGNIQAFISVVLVALAFGLAFYSFGLVRPVVILVGVSGALATGYFLFAPKKSAKFLVSASLAAILTVNSMMDFFIYPELLTYQSESMASHTVQSSAVKELVGFGVRSYSLDFYYGKHVPLVNEVSELQTAYPSRPFWIFTDQPGYDRLKGAGILFREEKVLKDTHVTTLTPEFLNPRTREGILNHNYLLLVDGF